MTPRPPAGGARRLLRVLLVAVVYVLGARLVLGVATAVTGELPVPPLFLTLLAGLLTLGLALALGIAWYYERVGGGGGGEGG